MPANPISDRARGIAEAARGLRCDNDEQGDAFWIGAIAPVIEKAFAAQANEIWEEAAKIADDNIPKGNLSFYGEGGRDTANMIGAAIRARKSSEPTT